MKTLIVAICLGIASPTLAQSPDPVDAEIITPSADAQELAHLLKPTSVLRMEMPTEYEVKQEKYKLGHTIIVSQQVGTPCDLNDKRCDAVATEIAEKMVQNRKAYMSKLSEYIYAVHFQRTLSADEIKESIILAKSSRGQSLLSAIMSVQNGKTFAEATNPYGSFLAKAPFPMPDTKQFYKEFYDRTKGLPRSKILGPPPPSMASPHKNGGQ